MHSCSVKWMWSLSRFTWCPLCCVNECTTCKLEESNAHLTQMSESSRFQSALHDWAAGLSSLTSFFWNSPTAAAAVVEVWMVELPPAFLGTALIRAREQGGCHSGGSGAAVSGAVLCRKGRAVIEPACMWASDLQFYTRVNHLICEVITHLQIW